METFLLHKRLVAEDEHELAKKIELCGTEIQLQCIGCGHRKIGLQRCKRKWCPYCAKVLASKRSQELEAITRHFTWPLFVTLTMKNTFNLSDEPVRKLRRAFGKLRHRKMWSKRVSAGIACIEVTNIGNGWHPHLHAVLDCQFLAWKTPLPSRGDSKEKKKALFQQAAIELEMTWAKILGQETSSVKVKRCNPSTIAQEVVKYAVKGSDLIESPDPIGDIIRCIEKTRLLTTFGNAHGQCVRDIRAKVKMEVEEKRNCRNKEELNRTPSEDKDGAGITRIEDPKEKDWNCCSSPCCVPFSISERILIKTSFHTETKVEEKRTTKKEVIEIPSCRADFTGGKLGKKNYTTARSARGKTEARYARHAR